MCPPDRDVDERPEEEERKPEQRQPEAPQQDEDRVGDALRALDQRQPKRDPARRDEERGGAEDRGERADEGDPAGVAGRDPRPQHCHEHYEEAQQPEADRTRGKPARPRHDELDPLQAIHAPGVRR